MSFGKRYINEENHLGHSSDEQSPDSVMDNPTYVEMLASAHINTLPHTTVAMVA